MINQNSKQNKNLIFSENAEEIIGRLVEKYQLDKEIAEEEDVKKGLESAENSSEKDVIKFLYSKNLGERLKNGEGLDEILASRKLLKIVDELNKNELSEEKTIALLQKNFILPQEDIEKINKELQEVIPLLFIEETVGENIAEKEAPISEAPLIKEKNSQPRGKDIYKEQIE